MKKVLVLCSANSIRSQMAEAYLKFYAKGYGLFFSAGMQKQAINPYALQVMKEDNIDLNEHISKTVEAFSNIHFDYLITVSDHTQTTPPSNFTFSNHVHFTIQDPAQLDGNEDVKTSAFLDTREEVKKCILQFIGRHLMPHTEPLDT